MGRDRAGFYELQSLPVNSSTLIDPSKSEKLANIGLRDVGLGNIRVVTALEMLSDYALTVDPLDLNKYKIDYGAFVRDLVNNVDGLQAKIAGLYVELGQDFFIGKLGAVAWSLYSDEQKAELLATYYNFGEGQLEATWATNTNNGTIPYDPRPSVDNGALSVKSYTELAGILNGTYVPELPDNGDLDEFLDVIEQAESGDEGAMAILLESLTGAPVDGSDIILDCFPAGTLIDIWASKIGGHLGEEEIIQKPIERITINDSIVTFDSEGNMVRGQIDKLFRNTTLAFVALQFDDERHNLITTPGHRFLTETGDYMEIGHMLRLGGGKARLVDVDGSIVEATGEVIAYSAETAHLFEVAQIKSIAVAGNTVLKEQVEAGWQTYNFEVREHHNYVAEGIRVHNDSILSTLEAGDQLVALNDDLTDAAVLRDVGNAATGNATPDGFLDFVALDGFRRDGDPTEIAVERHYYWANANLPSLLASVVANGPDAASEVFDPGNGNNWNDGLWGDDIEEAFFDDVVDVNYGSNTTPSRSDIDALYSANGMVRVLNIDGVSYGSIGTAFELSSNLLAISAIRDISVAKYDAVEIVEFVLGGSLSPLEQIAVENLFDDMMDGTGGADNLSGSSDDDYVYGLAGSDTLIGDDGDDKLVAGEGNDLVEGGNGRDTIYGGAGDDELYGDDTTTTSGSSTDYDDLIFGGDGHDVIWGGRGNDELHGGAGNDTIAGNGGVDKLYGDDGDDFLNGGLSGDELTGGTGADTFFHSASPNHVAKWVLDYSAAEDDVLLFKSEAGVTISDFNVVTGHGNNRGDANIEDVFIRYFPNVGTDNNGIIWAISDGVAMDEIIMRFSHSGQEIDLIDHFGL